MRIERPLCAALLCVFGAWLASAWSAAVSARGLAAALAVALIAAFGFVINDCCDVHVDSIGKPRRPLPSGALSCRAAWWFAWALAACGLAVSAALGAGPAVIGLLAVASSAAYSLCLKSTLLIGNAAVALPVALVPVFGAMVAGRITAAVAAAAAMTFVYFVAQEMLFNLEDEHDDRAAGLRTTATRLGAERCALAVRAALCVFVAVTLLPWSLGIAGSGYVAALLVCTVAPTLWLIVLLRAPVPQQAIVSAARWSRLPWLTSLIPLALLK